MKKLIILRHGMALGGPAKTGDRDRPLSHEGAESVAHQATWLKSSGISPDTVIYSPARRTRETANIVLTVLGIEPAEQILEELYLAPASTLLTALREMPENAERILVVGHNPGLEELVRWLDNDSATQLRGGLPPASLVLFDILGPWSTLSRANTRFSALYLP